MPRHFHALTAMLALAGPIVCAQPAPPTGELKGTAWVHSQNSD